MDKTDEFSLISLPTDLNQAVPAGVIQGGLNPPMFPVGSLILVIWVRDSFVFVHLWTACYDIFCHCSGVEGML